MQNYGEEIKKLDLIIDQINSVEDATALKRLINYALFVIYPNKGYNQEYIEEEFSSDKL